MQAHEHLTCERPPFIPERWSIESHNDIGVQKWRHSNLWLHVVPEQQGLQRITGHQLRVKLIGMPCCNAEVGDYLLKHPHYIRKWKNRYLFFWGTIYRSAEGSLYVAYLTWEEGGWKRKFHMLDYLWGTGFQAVLCNLE